MTRRGRKLLALLLAALVAAGGGGLLWRDEIARLVAVNTLFDPDRIVDNFSHMDRLFESAPMRAPVHEPSPLPRAPGPANMPAGFADWVADRGVTSVVVLRRGEVAFEEYYLGTGPDDLRVSWSLAKSFLGTLFGISVANGEIASIDDPVTTYVPALVGSAYDGASLRNLLNMASGVDFDEDYGNFFSDINRMGRTIALGGSLDRFAAGLDARVNPPGTQYRYVSMDTHVLGMALRGATGQSVPDLMNARIFTPLKLEKDPYYLTDSTGTAFVLGGLALTTRDYARFGQMVLNGGRAGGAQVVPEAWIDEMTRPTAPKGPNGGPGGGFGYQWWIPKDPRPGEVFARGLYGQFLWIDRSAGVVIAVTAADRGFEAPGSTRVNRDMLRAIVEEVR